MSYDGPAGGPVSWDETGPSIGGVRISREEAVNSVIGDAAGTITPPPPPSHASSASNSTKSPAAFSAFVIAVTTGVLLGTCSDQAPSSHTPTKPTPENSGPPIVQWAYYKTKEPKVTVNGETGPLQATFSKHACIVVSNTAFFGHPDLVEIRFPNPDGGKNLTGVTQRNNLLAAPECYERRM